MIRVKFLGSGDAFGSGGRFQTCYHIDSTESATICSTSGPSPTSTVSSARCVCRVGMRNVNRVSIRLRQSDEHAFRERIVPRASRRSNGRA